MSRWINLAGDAWAIIFLAYFTLLLVVSGISVFQLKKLTDMPLLGSLLIFLQFLWGIPFKIYIFIIGLPLLLPMIAICIAVGALLLGFAWISDVIERGRKRNV